MQLVVQNWVITPVLNVVPPLPGSSPAGATAATPGPATIGPTGSSTQPVASKIHPQKWLLVLSGVALIDHVGDRNGWLKKMVPVQPDVLTPLNHAIGEYNLPRPAASANAFPVFSVLQFASYGALGAVSNAGTSVHAGFAVDDWRLNPIDRPIANALGGGAIPQPFHGVQFDLAVRDKQAAIHRVNYHVTLLGRIAFGVPTLF